MQTIKKKNLNIQGKKVLVRCDFNVPLDEKGNILDDFRIRQTLPTIKYLRKEGAKVILISHLGDPGGEFVKELTTAPIVKKLEKLLGEKVDLLENLRFNPGEESNDDNFARELAKLGDIFVQDAFGVCHRQHASVVGIPKFLPSFAGLLLEKEINALDKIMKGLAKPLIAIIGGAKVETKAAVIDKISRNADAILLGGLIACEIKEKNINFKNPQKIVFPQDDVCAFDVNKQTVDLFKEKIKTAKTIFWNGPLGKVEKEEFRAGSLEIAKAIVESNAYSVAGGGETVWFLGKNGLIDKFNHVSTGGGAMLAYLTGEELPGLKALNMYGN